MTHERAEECYRITPLCGVVRLIILVLSFELRREWPQTRFFDSVNKMTSEEEVSI
jgi:hypothetical protein